MNLIRTGIVLSFLRTALLCSAALVVAGCSASKGRPDTLVPLEQLNRAPEAQKDLHWWYARFRISWPEEEPANDSVDLLLAHAVIGPVLAEYPDSLPRWRFHRRWARDKAGHQFSFIFYSEPATAERIFEAIDANSILDKAMSEGLVKAVIMDDPDNPVRPLPGDVSDKRWSATVQEHWPAYIMGSSALWLGLIDDQIRDAGLPADAEIETMLEAYSRAAERINDIWYREGQHALFHHLNAIFGYKPLLIKKELRF